MVSTSVTHKQFTVHEYHHLIESGFFDENSQVELICGEIMQMAAKGTHHAVCNTLLLEELIILLHGHAVVRGQEPVTLGDNSEPEPDFAIARQRPDRYLSSHPSPSDILWLIEVSDSTIKYDQEVKLSLYAESGISDYWIFNLEVNHLECYSQPYQNSQGKFGYAHKQIYLPNHSLALPYFPDLTLDLSRVFPTTSVAN